MSKLGHFLVPTGGQQTQSLCLCRRRMVIRSGDKLLTMILMIINDDKNCGIIIMRLFIAAHYCNRHCPSAIAWEQMQWSAGEIGRRDGGGHERVSNGVSNDFWPFVLSRRSDFRLSITMMRVRAKKEFNRAQ